MWYEIFDFSTNLSPEDCKRLLESSVTHKHIFSMHPHGIVPFHGAISASFCDQYLTDPDGTRSLYGVCGMASVVQYVPFLRNVLGWLCGVPVNYSTLKKGLIEVRTHN